MPEYVKPNYSQVTLEEFIVLLDAQGKDDTGVAAVDVMITLYENTDEALLQHYINWILQGNRLSDHFEVALINSLAMSPSYSRGLRNIKITCFGVGRRAHHLKQHVENPAQFRKPGPTNRLFINEIASSAVRERLLKLL